jgi:ABC-2 type transport system permease protein
MARLLVQLKLRLLANALRSSNRAKASFMTSTAFAVLTALGMFALLASLHGQSTAVSLTSFIFTVFAFGWLILPLLAFGLPCCAWRCWPPSSSCSAGCGSGR